MRAFSNQIKMSSQLNEYTALYASYVNISSVKSFDEDLMNEGSNLFLDENNYLSVLKEQMNDQHYGGKGIDIKAWLKAFDDWSNRLNLTWAARDYECGYCEGGLRDVMLTYNRIHGYVSLLVCLFGTLANVLNVAVLTRRDLATAPINRLLMWLAVADICVMVEYVPFAIYKYLVLPGKLDFSYSWAVYMLFHMHFTQIFHTASICLTLSLAMWRYIAIKYSERSNILCTERRCSYAIVSSFLLPPILCIPTYMVFTIRAVIIQENYTTSVLYHLDSRPEREMYQINFWVHGVLIKLLPCLILSAISFWLIRALYNANNRRRLLRHNQTDESLLKQESKTNITRQIKADKRTDRTTKMLLAVLFLFLVTELPQGILGLMSGLLGRCFFKRCYELFGELMDALALLNGAINFILYCSMSRQFRMAFGQLFRAKIMIKWPTTSHTDIQNTFV